MKVKDILNQKGTRVLTIQSDQTVRDALGILVQERIGALVVLGKKGEIAGIVSERDIIRECHSRGRDWESRKISDIMTSKLLVGRLDDEIDYVMGIMTKNRVRHLPIVSDQKLAGLISIGDVVKAQLDDKEYENRYLKDYMFGTYTES